MNVDKINLILAALYNFLLIVRNKTGEPKKVVIKHFFEYFILKTTQLFLGVTKIKIESYSVFGFKFIFFDFAQFIPGFEEHFICNDYYFSSKSKTPLIIDCGANIGDSVLYFKSLYPDSEIIAFEADPSTFKLLSLNISNNSLEKIQANNLAVFDKEKELDFYFDPKSLGAGTMSLFKERLPKSHLKVKTTLLSKFITKKVDLLKVDIEGAEINVLKDLDENKKLRLVEKMIIEYHHNIPKKKNELKQILEILEKNNFECQFSTGFKPPFIENMFQDILVYAYR